MADIDLYQDDGDECTSDGYGFDNGFDGDETFGADDNLTPLQKLEKYMESDNVYTRQMVAKGLLDTLRAVGDSDEETTAVLTAMVKLSEDSDPIVRSELMEQVPHVAVYCQENRDIFQNAIPVYILSMVVRYLDDANNQVRKTSQAALLVLLEQELINNGDIDEQVVNVILELASPDSLDDYRTEAVALMSKMAPLLGKEMTERVFLNRFCEMCCDPLFHVRKVCAANFGDLCQVVCQASTEQFLLPKFFYLCEDGVWGVRKACAECFMSVSCSCSSDVRKSDLASLFVNLLCDQSRWVRMAAFQQLGPFISTFANADLTGIYVADDGSLVFKCIEEYIKQKEELEAASELLNKPMTTTDDTTGDSNSSQLPAVIADETSDISASQDHPNCDNISPIVNMDLSQDCEVNNSESSDSSSSNRELNTESNSELAYQQDSQSVEEKRAEHYLNIHASTENADSHVSIQSPDVVEYSNLDSNNDSSSTDNNTSLEGAGSPSSRLEEDRVGVGKIGIAESNAIEETSLENKNDNRSSDVTSVEKSGHVHIHLGNANNFNAFQFWRSPLPQFNLDLELVDGQPKNIHVTAQVKDDEHNKVCASEMNIQVSSEKDNIALYDSVSDLRVCDSDERSAVVMSLSESVVNESGVTTVQCDSVSTMSDADKVFGHTDAGALTLSPRADLAQLLDSRTSETTIPVIDGIVQDISSANLAYIDSDFSTSTQSSFQESIAAMDDATLAQQQDIVPQSLLESYLGMIDPSRAQTVDTEITKYCAYNLPAVAYTLGRNNWHCIKNLYETLAADMQWKVRRTLAFSIHELAVILGEEVTHRDLVPVFDGFLKDLDEVRIGILRHLADFFRLLHPDVRRQYLTKIQDFMNVDNSRNWRFRLELAEQLVLICELYSAQEISEYVLPLAMALVEDRVCQVRQDAYHLLSVILRRLDESQDEKLVQYLVSQCLGRFAHNQKWAARQIYIQLCQSILLEEAIGPSEFAKEFLPSLLSLASDRVPNVRISLARFISCYILHEEYYSKCDNSPDGEVLAMVLEKLQSDPDRDVRYFCSSELCQRIRRCQLSES